MPATMPSKKPKSRGSKKSVVKPTVKIQPIEEEVNEETEESLDVDKLPQKRASPDTYQVPTLQVSREVNNSDSLVCEDDYET